jgi:signal peptidase I
MRRLLRRRLGDRARLALTWAGTFVLALVVASAASQLVVGRPFGLVPISGDAMAPALRGGGMVLCLPYLWSDPSPGDIVVFRPPSLDYDLCRRIVGVSPHGWVTKGDSMAAVDQAADVRAVTRADIHGYVPQVGGRPVYVPAVGLIAATPGSRGRLVLALAAALVLVAVPPAKAAGRRLSPRRRRSVALSRVWVYALAAVICTALTTGAAAWLGGETAISLAPHPTEDLHSSSAGPVAVEAARARGRVTVTNGSPVALLVLAYGEPLHDSVVDRRFALVPAQGSQSFGLTRGAGLPQAAIKLAYAPALVPADWLYPMVREWGALWGFASLAAMQCLLAAALLCSADVALSVVRR